MPATLQSAAAASAARTAVDRARTLLTPLNLHFTGLALLTLVNLYLVVHMVYAYQQAHSQNDDAVAQQMALLHSADLAARPLQGLDAKLSGATAESDLFYARRLPSAESQVLAELGALTARQHVKLSRVQYAQAAVLANTPGELTEVKMDANLSGDYRPLVTFLNSLERDRMFFLISNIALTGQQGGTVNLRLRLASYLRARAPGDPPFAASTAKPVEAVAVDPSALGQPAPDGPNGSLPDSSTAPPLTRRQSSPAAPQRPYATAPYAGPSTPGSTPGRPRP